MVSMCHLRVQIRFSQRSSTGIGFVWNCSQPSMSGTGLLYLKRQRLLQRDDSLSRDPILGRFDGQITEEISLGSTLGVMDEAVALQLVGSTS